MSAFRRRRNIGRQLLVKPRSKVDLTAHDPADTSLVGDKESAKAQLKEDSEAIDALQDKLFAERRRALLIILQGTDTSGKDGTVRGVFRTMGPLGVAVTAFAAPSSEDLAHDFLWRVHKACPQRGTIGIFNRSHYEDVLVGRVRSLAPPEVIERRYDQINAFEDLISSSTRIVKFMLHISKEEQRRRLQARLDDPDKRWKFSPGDLEDREHWDAYQHAYEMVLARCSTRAAPWYVIPADKKWARNAAVAAIVRATLEDMDPRYPAVDWDPAAFEVR
ncbi:polyphosphate kinase 2 family protein [Enterovirga sp.]|uniref:polyphosphate kinase 2 family protein n=1 Tax=Enterovirga sp. TaxID=2026350 RepID=UPI0026363992|nr:polyphosphate kinase 2 family protein [Enterovirga sp.]MDB5591660.1 polyphosphate kinase [Enterovirga sp.]